MRKFYIVGLIVIATFIIGLVYAEQMTLTTYYPAPYGMYKDVTLANSLSVEGVPIAQAPAVAPAGQGRIYFDSNSNKFKVSENGGAYTDLGGGGSGAFWAETASGGHIYNTNTGNIGIGTNNPGASSHKLHVAGPARIINGNLAIGASNYITQPLIVLGTSIAEVGANDISVIVRRSGYTRFRSGSSGNIYLTDTGNCGIGTSSPTATLHVNGSLSKTSGSFEIPHPDPAKEGQGWKLRHSFVESPTRGDNLYRWVVEVEHGTATIELPEYFPYLNENVQVWVSPVRHFGMAYGEVNPELTKIVLAADTDGLYNVLAMGTRKDRYAKEWFDELGVEFQAITKELEAEE